MPAAKVSNFWITDSEQVLWREVEKDIVRIVEKIWNLVLLRLEYKKDMTAYLLYNGPMSIFLRQA